MKKLSLWKRSLVYTLATLIAIPTWLGIGILSISKAQAAGLDTQDFGVMQISGVNGYSVGFGLLGMTASDLKSVKVELFKGASLLSTSDAIIPSSKWTGIASATSLSSPFNINGYFDYADDGYWANSGWNGTVLDVPTKAKVSITDISDITYSGEYGAPTGNPALLLPNNYIGAGALAVVQPAEFGTMRFSGVSGYDVGFSLVTYKASRLKKINVELFKGDTSLGAVVSNNITALYPDAMTLSAPFDVNGTFDYVADTSWTYSGWNGTLANIPTRAVIKVTDKMDNTYTVENNTLTGTPLPYMVAEDFGVMQISGVNGYTVGFGLNGITATDVASAKVELFKGTELLSTSNALISSLNWGGITSATSLSAPFNIDGTFNYALDGYWSNTGWNGSLLDVPTRAVVTVKDTLGANYIIENNNLTGDPNLLLPTVSNQNPIIVKVVQGTDKNISIDFTGAGTEATDYVILVNGIPALTVANTLGTDTANVYHIADLNVLAYGIYSIEIQARHLGVKVGAANSSVDVKAPATTAISAGTLATTRRVAGNVASNPTSSVQLDATNNQVVTPVPPVDQGQVKAAETSAPATEEPFNWTPWIILIIIIILAGAATGGYFYWTRGDETVAKSAVATKVVKKPVAKTTSDKKVVTKKTNRW